MKIVGNDGESWSREDVPADSSWRIVHDGRAHDGDKGITHSVMPARGETFTTYADAERRALALWPDSECHGYDGIDFLCVEALVEGEWRGIFAWLS